MPTTGTDNAAETGRSPHGERGLKFDFWRVMVYHARVALLMESVD